MAKKYRYDIGHFAEGLCHGTIDLTKKEAAIVAYALDESNWASCSDEGWSGSFWIDTDNPTEIPENE